MIDALLLPRAGQDDVIRPLRRAWWILALFDVTVLLDFGLTLIGHGRPSRALLALAGGFVVLTLLTVAAAALLNAERLERVRSLLRPLNALIGPMCLALPFVFGLVIRPQFIYGHVGLALALTAALAVVTLAPNAQANRRLWTAGIILAAVAALFLRAYSLSRTPYVSVIDEPWNLSWSMTYLQTGHVSEFTMVGQPGDPTYYNTEYIPRWAIPVAWWLKLVGVGLWQARLFSLIVTLPVIAATAAAARNLYGNITAGFTAAALFAGAILVIGMRLRHDIGVALALALSLWLYSEALKRNQLGLHLLAGLLMGWGGFAHYHAFGFAPVAAVALYLPRYVVAWRASHRLPEAGAWLYVLGVVLGLGSVAVVQILPDVTTFLVNRAPRNPLTPADYIKTLIKYVGKLGEISWYETLLIGLSLIAALRRRRAIDVSLVMFVILAHLALAVMTTLIDDTYLVPLVPLYGLLIGALVTDIVGVKPSNRLVALVVGLCFVMPVFGQTLKTPVRDVIARKPVITPTPTVDQWIIDHVPTRYTIMGENADYFWLHDYRYDALWLLDFVPPSLLERYPSREDFLLSLKPDVILFHPDISTYGALKPMLDDPAYLPSHGYQRVAEFPGTHDPALVYARDGVVTR